MYFSFLWEVLKRAFNPAPRVTDMLQILAASALPAAAKFIGLPLPQNAGEDALAYIGLIALSYVVIRLFWAPYSLWKDDRVTIGELKLELTKPERMVMEHLARHKAKAIQKLKTILVDTHNKTYDPDREERSDGLVSAMLTMEKLIYKSGLDHKFHRVIGNFFDYCVDNRRDDGGLDSDKWEFAFFYSILNHIDGGITVEVLERQLQSNIAAEKQR